MCCVRDVLRRLVEAMHELDEDKDVLRDTYFTLWTVITEWLKRARVVQIGEETITVDAILSDLDVLCGGGEGEGSDVQG